MSKLTDQAAANSLSIWTHNFLKREFNSSWPIPGSNSTADGGISKEVATALSQANTGLVPIKSIKLLLLQPRGEILTANAEQNPDLLWAIRGGGPGKYGLVTEFVLQAHPAVSSVVAVNLEVIPLGSENDTTTATAAWSALAILFQSIPDLMDTGLAGAMTAATGSSARGLSGSESTPPGVYFSQAFYGYNISTSEMDTVISPVIEKMKDISNGSLSLNYTVTDVYPTYLDFFYAGDPGEDPAGQVLFFLLVYLGARNSLISQWRQ
ncbi:uncharacterized protein EAF02_001138 [Botrytis sinoallii]|uniref:uncharacterized protein n=1 Tax=Botrytis sinoallii TaxID=1463999 RepID=UPI001901BC18|nr:uncharacterized protein EAF02_001138 [Botrytis sinoallii]KAF7893600.1 hypothetical protein EAF02_001138 [Botrytis sinoallii]